MPRPIVINKKRRHKYGVSEVSRRTVDGIVFDSREESKCYTKLKMLVGLDKISLQPEFILQDGFVHEGKKYRPIKYVGDFLLRDDTGGEHVIDVKGVHTPEFKLKSKMLTYRYAKVIHTFQKESDLFKFLESLRGQGKLTLKMM